MLAVGRIHKDKEMTFILQFGSVAVQDKGHFSFVHPPSSQASSVRGHK